MKNLHLEHVEDFLFEGSVLSPIIFLKKVLDFVSGVKNDNLLVSTKWDGAPAFVAGEHPENHQFFVGTKGVFAGKINYNEPDIIRNYSDQPGLQRKLIELFNALNQYEISQIIQGDLLWTSGPHLWQEEGVLSYRFRPNTLEYRIPANSVFGEIFRNSALGAVIHTTYTGNTIQTLEAQIAKPCVFKPKTPTATNIFLFTPQITLHEPLLRRHEEINLNAYYTSQSAKAWEIDVNLLNFFQNTPKLQEMAKQYVNYCVKNGDAIFDIGFQMYVASKFTKHIASLKTAKGRNRVQAEQADWFLRFSSCDLKRFFAFYEGLQTLKFLLLRALDRTKKDVGIFLPDGRECGHEGYVVFDKSTGEMCKFVDRDVFSRANMTEEKIWN